MMKFIKLSDTVVAGNPAGNPTGSPNNKLYPSLDQYSLCILVGVTGVGKTTLKKKLLETYQFYSLPGRRTLTDKIILPLMQQEGEKGPVHDRCKRFSYTKAFRTAHPGGMGVVLSQIRINPQGHSIPFLFDGLRGVDEVSYAAKALPSAFFIVLTAPDHLRVKRLLSRRDDFDRTHGNHRTLDPTLFNTICTLQQREQLIEYVKKNGIQLENLYEKVKIVVKEKQNYDQDAAKKILISKIPDRTLVMDTSKYSPQEMVAAMAGQLENRFFLDD